jgi:Transposase DDE domain group 1
VAALVLSSLSEPRQTRRNCSGTLPSHRPGRRRGRQILVRADAGGCTHAFLDWLVGRRLQYSIGFALPTDVAETLEKIREQVWTSAYDADGRVREGAHVAEVSVSGLRAGHPLERIAVSPADAALARSSPEGRKQLHQSIGCGAEWLAWWLPGGDIEATVANQLAQHIGSRSSTSRP